MREFLLVFVFWLSGWGHALEPRMSWLDNGTIRVGADLALGGAITWLSRSGDDRNVINSYDWGRQVQMSYYGGPVPFVVGDKRPRKVWEGLGWNPIQAGDDFGHGSQVIEHSNDGRGIYVKCIPMQWPLDNVPGDCAFESWLELEGNSVRARCRLTNVRADKSHYGARDQELPAVYTNGWLHRIVSYTGDKPFTGAEVSVIPPKGPAEGWTRWWATEGWTALVDEAGWGLGVWSPVTIRHIGGFNGTPGRFGPKDTACGYVAPVRREVLDHNIVHEYTYDLVLGSVEEIRAHASRRRNVSLPAWGFTDGRGGWIVEGARDQGWPIAGELLIRGEGADSRVVSPPFAMRAESGGDLVITAAFPRGQTEAEIFWATLKNPDFAGARAVRFATRGDGEMRDYRVPLSALPEFTGLITQLRLDLAEQPGAEARLMSVRFENSSPGPSKD